MTNIRLDPALWAKVKAAAGERGTTLERWVTDALELHLERGRPGAAPAGASADGRAPGSDGAPGAPSAGAGAQGGLPGPADALQALHWRIEALEQAVDYLAGVVGAGFPRDASRPGGGPPAGA